MQVVDVIAAVLKREGVTELVAYPRCPIIEAAAHVGIRPIICRQERVGVGIADGFSRVSNGKRIGVFAMQHGPGAENAFSGIATAYADSSPILLLPMGYARDESGWPRFFNSTRAYAFETKWAEQVNHAGQTQEALRRAFSRLRMGRPGPVLLEIPNDVAMEDVAAPDDYRPATLSRAAGDGRDVDEAARMLLEAASPIITAGQGVLYAEATPELVELAELLQVPVTTTLLGKSAFPETHALSLGTSHGARRRYVSGFIDAADVVLGVGTSFTKHPIASIPIPAGKKMIQITNDEGDVNKNYIIDQPIIGDAKLVLRQIVDAVRDRLGGQKRDTAIQGEIKSRRETWLADWLPQLTRNRQPMSPFRVVWELGKTIPPEDSIVTHDSGGPRGQLVAFYDSAGPRSYLGWGRSHGLGTGLGLTIGAKLAAPEKVCMNWMGDAAFGMVGLDFETAVRCNIPIITLLSNNFAMAAELGVMPYSTEKYRSTDIGGNYADLARSLGGYGERVEDPEQIGAALLRARKVTETEGRPALLEFITSRDRE